MRIMLLCAISLYLSLAAVAASSRTAPAEFQDPPSMYRTSPFWSWNSALDDEELRWQIREFKDKGFAATICSINCLCSSRICRDTSRFVMISGARSQSSSKTPSASPTEKWRRSSGCSSRDTILRKTPFFPSALRVLFV